jgi:nicotinamide mononucleotide adenylyltransferase
MEPLMIDRTKLKKISSYAKMINKSVQWVYNLEKENKIKIVEIDGVKFVEL